MISKFALLGNLLLASAALAVPSSQLVSRSPRRRENRQSQPINRVVSSAGAVSAVESCSGCAGAVWVEPAGTFKGITDTFAVPTGDSGVVTISIGIDGDTCESASLQIGIDVVSGGGGAWYQWYPGGAYDFPGISISTGDTITATITATSTTFAVVEMENVTTGQTATQSLTSSYALCEENAEWIVDFEDDFTGSGTFTITDATATGAGGIVYTPSGATIIDSTDPTATVTANGETLTIQYS